MQKKQFHNFENWRKLFGQKVSQMIIIMIFFSKDLNWALGIDFTEKLSMLKQ